MTHLQLSFNILTFLKIDKRTENSVLIADYWELVVKVINSDPKVIKLFFILNSAEHEIYPAHKC